MKRMRKGFTLVELLIVVAILGALSAAMTVAAKDSTPKAKATKIASDFKVIASAVSFYITDSNDTTPTVKYFTAHSDDYLMGGKMGAYKVTSTDATTSRWYVEYTPALDVSVATELAKISADMSFLGQKKMRIR